jgi:hypothetical protein
MKTNPSKYTLTGNIPSITRSEILAMPETGLDEKSISKLRDAAPEKYVFANLIPGNGMALFWGTGGEAKLAAFSDKSGIRRVILDVPSSPSPAAPCPSASHLPLVPPVGVTDSSTRICPDCSSTVFAGRSCPFCEGNPRLNSAQAPTPVSPSLPEFTERAGFPWHATGTEIRRADNDAIASIHFATPSNRSLPSINEAEKLAKLICETLASHATLKADVERLTGALTVIAGMDPYLGEAMQDVAQEALLSLAEVGK